MKRSQSAPAKGNAKAPGLEGRAASKAAARKADAARLDAGESPSALQKDNSIFSERFFEGGSFTNLSAAIGQ